MMDGTNYKDLILQTIDQLRKRKARPDLERICHIMGRKHKLSSNVVLDELNKLVGQKIVIKVDYKGSVSYRNAAKWRKSSSYIYKEVPEKYELSQPALIDFEEGTSDQQPTCANETEQENTMTEDKCEINSIPMDQEITVNVPNDQDNFVEQDTPRKKSKISPGIDGKPKQGLKRGPKPKLKGNMSRAHDFGKYGYHREKTPSPGKRGRGPKRKRIQKTHGPDFESYVLPHKLARRVSVGEEEIVRPSRDQQCDFCLLTSELNPNGDPEDLLICKDCQSRAHPSCMEYSEDLARRARNSPWQCMECKTCYICQDSGDAVRNDAMLFCDSCDKGYHMECHDPPIEEKPTGTWVCSRCQCESPEPDTAENDDRTIVNGSVNGDCSSPPPSLPTPRDSPVPFTDRLYHPPLSVTGNSSQQYAFVMGLPSFRRYADRTVPDASTWSVQDVVDFFFEAGFRDECETFREQEIDGKSLLLMKRSDVLQGLSIKLGPALKIYAHVQRLQTQGSFII